MIKMLSSLSLQTCAHIVSMLAFGSKQHGADVHTMIQNYISTINTVYCFKTVTTVMTTTVSNDMVWIIFGEI